MSTEKSQQPSDTPIYSIVAPIYNEAETLPHFYQRAISVMEGVGESFELIFINDGSRDESYNILCRLHNQDVRVRVVDFARNFGHAQAIMAGLTHARGQAVIMLDSDLQDPPEVVPQLIKRWREGGEVISAQRVKRRGEQHSNCYRQRLSIS
ncbi:hypothetical protein KSC_110500 [Ktedonobacter sp. SOSP1-52]|uniref:glycosyltransferase family 2 protein n=1 Tax=Ktedonobacter sp. SOSP1-52 TaxID=2778366 RepID=UPI0019155566|nr:glycosyltransferase family 2 protein [Ktedonobacter sp. SOSP1-52]GHO72158.1 hypothetical protein KSC_110500 [Ktedonobacter sp. SOSP1-52]